LFLTAGVVLAAAKMGLLPSAATEPIAADFKNLLRDDAMLLVFKRVDLPKSKNKWLPFCCSVWGFEKV
jgi:hypothetical protein